MMFIYGFLAGAVLASVFWIYWVIKAHRGKFYDSSQRRYP